MRFPSQLESLKSKLASKCFKTGGNGYLCKFIKDHPEISGAVEMKNMIWAIMNDDAKKK